MNAASLKFQPLWAYLQLMRPANIITAWADILAGYAASGFVLSLGELNAGQITPGSLVSLAWLLLSTTGLYGGGVVFNAVLNDFDFLTTLGERDWRAGIAEAVKVALIEDGDFFEFIETQAEALAHRHMDAMQQLIYRCAQLHLEHIANNGDPFEMGSSRPLDFGHWAAHKLEQLTNYTLRHGEAVAIGMALDSTYSYLAGLLSHSQWQRVLNVLQALEFSLYVSELAERLHQPDHPRCLFRGLAEFREHLGGELTITLLREIGQGIEVHEVDLPLYEQAISLLAKLAK